MQMVPAVITFGEGFRVVIVTDYRIEINDSVRKTVVANPVVELVL